VKKVADSLAGAVQEKDWKSSGEWTGKASGNKWDKHAPIEEILKETLQQEEDELDALMAQMEGESKKAIKKAVRANDAVAKEPLRKQQKNGAHLRVYSRQPTPFR